MTVRSKRAGTERRNTMALFQAFRAVRPAEGKAEKVAALPYDVVSREEAREIGEKIRTLFSM